MCPESGAEEMERFLKEHAAEISRGKTELSAAIALFMNMWAQIEQHHTFMLSRVLWGNQFRVNPDRLAADMYYAFGDPQARMDLVSTAFKGVVEGFSANDSVKDEIRECWRRLREKIRSNKDNRNVVAHGGFWTVKGTKPIVVWMRNPDHPKSTIAKGQLPGFTAGQILGFTEVARELADLMAGFLMLMNFHLGKEQESFDRTYRELAMRLNPLPPRLKPQN